jgi:gentisate 1,2-dioxygenase
MAPSNYQRRDKASPIINYPYTRTKEALASLEARGDPDPHLGHIIKYLNPLSGDWAMPTIAAQMRVLPQGFESRPYQSTDSTVFVVVEGSGVSHIGAGDFDWEQGDVFVAPSWMAQQHQARKRSVLFSFSDRAAQEKLGLWREKRHDRPEHA